MALSCELVVQAESSAGGTPADCLMWVDWPSFSQQPQEEPLSLVCKHTMWVGVASVFSGLLQENTRTWLLVVGDNWQVHGEGLFWSPASWKAG